MQAFKHVVFASLFFGVVIGAFAALIAACALVGDPALLTLAVIAAGLAGLFVLYQSIYILREDARLVVLFIGTRTDTLVSGTFVNRHGPLPPEMHCGLFGLDIAFLPWPLWRGSYLPTEAFKVIFDASDPVFDQESISMLVDSTLYLQFLGAVDHLLVALGLTKHLFGRDFARIKKIHYNGIDMETYKVKQMEYEGPALAEVLKNLLQEAVDSAIMTVSGKYSWQEICRQVIERENAAVQDATFSDEVQDVLTPDNQASLFTAIGIFNADGAPGPAIMFPDAGRPAQAQGEAVAYLRIERATPKDKALVEAQTAPQKARKAATADAIAGEGRGDHVRNYKERAGITGREVVAAEALEKTNAKVTIIAAQGVLDASAARLLGPPGNESSTT